MRQEDQTTSEHLKGFVLRPAPQYLRQKILAAAKEIRPHAYFLTSVQWGMAAACALLIVGALAGDAFLSRTLAGRLDVLLNESPADFTAAGAERTGIEEIVGVGQARLLYAPSTRLRHDRSVRTNGRGDWDESAFEEKENADVLEKNPR